jgi:hypothetical protein
MRTLAQSGHRRLAHSHPIREGRTEVHWPQRKGRCRFFGGTATRMGSFSLLEKVRMRDAKLRNGKCGVRGTDSEV